MRAVLAAAVLAAAVLLTACSPSGATPAPVAPADIATTATTATSGSSMDGTPATTQPAATSPVEAMTCWAAPADTGTATGLVFEDVTEAWGLLDPLVGMHGHAAAFGDIDGDNRPDLVVGTFADRPPEDYMVRGAEGPNPDRLLVGGPPAQMVEGWSSELGRTSGAVFADFDGDGRSDLLMIRHDGDEVVPSQVYANRGGALEAASEPLPAGFEGRTPAVADFDLDGLLDVYVSQDRYGETGGLLLHNRGAFQFDDATPGSGLEGVFALGATAADLNADGLPDLVTSDRIFVNTGNLSFEDVTPENMSWEQIGPDDDPAGVAVADLNGDGWPEVVVGQHYRSTVEVDAEVAIRLWVHQGLDGEGFPLFEESPQGVPPFPTLAPHVAVADMDNDGRPDIVTSASSAAGAQPAVLRNLGGEIPDFETPAGLGPDQYWVGAPAVDLDQDGRLDLFAIEWEPSLPSIMFRNVSAAGHWLEVSVAGPGMGVGAVVEVQAADGALLGRREIGVAQGYSSGTLPVAHVGLGDHEVVRVELSLPDGSSHLIGTVPADRHLRWPEGC